MADKPTKATQNDVADETIESSDSVVATAVAVANTQDVTLSADTDNDLGPASELFPPLAMPTSELLAEIEDAMGGEPITPAMLTNVGLPLGGGKYFSLPVLDEDEESSQRETFTGIVLGAHLMRTYWEKPYGSGTGEPTPPDCSSPDALVAIPGGAFSYGSEANPAGTCATCPMAQFGSAPVGNGQACKLKAVIYILMPGHRFPVRLILPPTSLSQRDEKGWKTYRQRLTMMAGASPSSVITEVGLRQQQFGQGRTASSYSVATFKAVGPKLTKTEKARAKALAESLRHALIPSSPVVDQDLLEAPQGDGGATAATVTSSGDF